LLGRRGSHAGRYGPDGPSDTASDTAGDAFCERLVGTSRRECLDFFILPAEKAERLRTTMERVFPKAMVTGYEPLIAAMRNHTKDRDVVAAAVKAGAQAVITVNLKDFTPLPDGIEAQSPDEFLCNLSDDEVAERPILLRSARCHGSTAMVFASVTGPYAWIMTSV
jgi:hypothetical protein